jgi:3'-phosphoadenosine 5'-phosphosulfate sulfotransferase (PAPS reductase)/FAD synthetase
MVDLPHDLRRLEAESVYIFREVVAEFRKPVLLYSIGKDSSVMLHLARKAFHPFSGDAHRHHLEIPGDDSLPRPDRGAARP